MIDTLRRFSSSIRTLPGLAAKKKFLDQKGTAIIVETQTTTAASKISELEGVIGQYMSKIKIPVYFCKGLSQEIAFYQNGQQVVKVRGYNFEKLLKKIPGS